MDQMEKNLPDLVVLDVMMPGLGGLEVLKQIKSLYAKIPVILLTGRGSTADGIEGMRLGAFDYLMKPIDIDELIKKISDAVPE
jgi:DNA-binding response OmpR family regulator